MESFVTRRSTHTLLLLLFLVAAIAGTLLLVRERQELRKKAEAAVTLELIPSSKDVNQGEEFSLDVVISTGPNQVTRADLTILYDADYLDGLTIQNGNFLPETCVAGLNQNGIANIGLCTSEADPRQGQNQLLATLRFLARNPIESMAVSFDEGGTAVVAVGGVIVPVATTGSQVKVIRTVTPDTSLRFEPQSASVQAGENVSVDVHINTGSNRVTVVDAVVNYDANTLAGVSFTQTNLLPRVLRSGTNADGTARITLGSSETQPFQGEGVLGVLTFRGQTAGSTDLVFSNQTKVTAFGTEENMLREGQAGTVTVTGTTPPVPTPAPTPTPSDGTGGTPVSPPPGCTRTAPLPPANLRASVTERGSVNLAWNESVYATHYGIVYGRSPGRYEYGAANVGYTSVYTVRGLAANTTYYFAVFAVNDCAPSGYSNEVAARTLGTGVTGRASPRATGTVPVASPLESPAPGFVPLPPDKGEVIPFLAGGGRRVSPPPVPGLPSLTIPAEVEPETRSPLLTPLGGLLLIIVALFLGIFFWRMRSN